MVVHGEGGGGLEISRSVGFRGGPARGKVRRGDAQPPGGWGLRRVCTEVVWKEQVPEAPECPGHRAQALSRACRQGKRKKGKRKRGKKRKEKKGTRKSKEKKGKRKRKEGKKKKGKEKAKGKEKPKRKRQNKKERKRQGKRRK